VVSFTPRPLYPQGKRPWCPSDRRLGGPQSLSVNDVEEKNSQPSPGLERTILKWILGDVGCEDLDLLRLVSDDESLGFMKDGISW
jgi:hypothetical protein